MREDNPGWITAESYLGLNRHIQIEEEDATNVEMMYLHCLRYGMMDTDVQTINDPVPLPEDV